MKQLVIMPGGFHPFHAGHLALYQSALQAFPGADVKVAATNDTSSRPFPFKLKEKLAQLAGVSPGDFYQKTLINLRGLAERRKMAHQDICNPSAETWHP
jgi:phosphopantetheine adenylyltransferase